MQNYFNIDKSFHGKKSITPKNTEVVLECRRTFTQLGARINKEGNTNEDIYLRISQEFQWCFKHFNSLRRSTNTHANLKLNIYKSVVR